MNTPQSIQGKLSVSVIIPNYNYADFLPERIDTIIGQTYQIKELIIIDDASTDNSVVVIRDKIQQITQKFPKIKIKFLQNKKNSGGCVFAQWQKGVKASTGDCIWIAEADDSSNRHFLETVLPDFQNDKVVLAYTDSQRIDEKGNVTATTSQDLCDIWQSHRWANDFQNSGDKENKQYLSAHNTIINVSSLVWRNIKQLPEIFEEAKHYKIAGDWYIYTRVLEYGDIAYHAQPLNLFRKHSQGSVSSTINRILERDEVCAIQERMQQKYRLSQQEQFWQVERRHYMGFTENPKNQGKKGRIAWVVPNFASGGAGGHRTIFQNINKLVEYGYMCDMFIDTDEAATDIMKRLEEGYGEFLGDIYNTSDIPSGRYDMIFATDRDTVDTVCDSDCKNKMYFIQDFESFFFPMGSEYLATENTYKRGLKGVTIGNWLSYKMNKDYHMQVEPFNFCADLNCYHPLKNSKKELAICYIFQPDKPRRCSELALRALHIVQMLRPEIKIYVYGFKNHSIKNVKVTYLDILPIEECNKLYNKCTVGLCMSATNPSRIPFEMMAAGLPVVDLYRENNLYDLPDDGCLLADTTPEAIAAALLRIIDDKKLQERMSKKGVKFMQPYPLETGYQQFLDVVDKAMSSKKFATKTIKKLYTTKAATATSGTSAQKKLLSKEQYCDSQEDIARQPIYNAWENEITDIQKSRAYRLAIKVGKVSQKIKRSLKK